MNFYFSIALISMLTAQADAASLIITPGELGSVTIEMDLLLDGTLKRFQLDTGANKSRVVLDRDTETYPSEGKEYPKGATGIPLECDVIRIKAIAFDSTTVPNLTLHRCELGVHGFNNMGIDVIEGLVVDLNFSNKEIRILNDFNFNRSTPLSRLSKGHLKIPIRLQEKASSAIFDTGAQLTTIDLSFINANPEKFKFIGTTTATDLNGHPIEMKLYKIVSLVIGTLEINDAVALSFDFKELKDYFGPGTPVILGSNVITKANWQLDLKQNRFAVEPF